jgi:hypothetical protein
MLPLSLLPLREAIAYKLNAGQKIWRRAVLNPSDNSFHKSDSGVMGLPNDKLGPYPRPVGVSQSSSPCLSLLFVHSASSSLRKVRLVVELLFAPDIPQ